MKKFLFIQRIFRVVGLFILFLIPFWVNAQVYHPLVDSGAAWNLEYSFTDIFSQSGEVTGQKFFLQKDTIIQSIEYLLLKCQPTYYYTFFLGSGFSYGYNYPDSSETIGAIREDSSKKVWVRKLPSNFNWPVNFPLDTEALLYDFNLQVGDTFLANPDGSAAVVSSIDSIQLLNGEWRMLWTVGGFWESPFWIEGVGSEAGLLGTLFGEWEGATYLSCYHDHGELLLGGPGLYANYISCDAIDGVNETRNSSFHFTIFPNPATDFLFINFSSPNFSSARIKITDMLGRNLFSDEIKSGHPLQISTEKFFGNRMIFCQLWQDGKLIALKKVLIQK